MHFGIFSVADESGEGDELSHPAEDWLLSLFSLVDKTFSESNPGESDSEKNQDFIKRLKNDVI